MSEDIQPSNFLGKIRFYWPIIAGFVALLAWAITSIATASVSVSTVEHILEDHSGEISKVSRDMDTHKNEGNHPKTNERLVKLESEVRHLQTTQSENFKDIKKQLNIMQQDIKSLPR